MGDNEGLHLQTSNPLSFRWASPALLSCPPLAIVSEEIINFGLLYEKTGFGHFPKDTLPARDQPSRQMRDSTTDSL